MNRKLSIPDEVVIALALRSEIRHYAQFAKLAIELQIDARTYCDSIRDLVHAYNAVSDTPFETDDIFVISLLSK